MAEDQGDGARCEGEERAERPKNTPGAMGGGTHLWACSVICGKTEIVHCIKTDCADTCQKRC